MSELLHEADTHCPYCGEPITLVVDLSVDGQTYIEDCFVCCRPIRVTCHADGGTFGGIEVDTNDG
jgi:hypothetical protein